MKKLVLGLMAAMMILGSLKAFADDGESTQTSNTGDAAALLFIGALKVMSEGLYTGNFDVYSHDDGTQKFKIVLLPIDVTRKISAIDKSSATDSEKVAQVADLFVELASNTAPDSFCSVSARVYTSQVEDKAQREKDEANYISRCHSKLTKERIMKKADKLFSKEELNSLQLAEQTSAFRRYRIAYSVGAFLLML